MKVEDGSVVVTTPCGAAVVDLVDGNIRYDEATAGAVVGVAGDQLFILDDAEGDRSGIRALRFETGRPGWSLLDQRSLPGRRRR